MLVFINTELPSAGVEWATVKPELAFADAKLPSRLAPWPPTRSSLPPCRPSRRPATRRTSRRPSAHQGGTPTKRDRTRKRRRLQPAQHAASVSRPQVRDQPLRRKARAKKPQQLPLGSRTPPIPYPSSLPRGAGHKCTMRTSAPTRRARLPNPKATRAPCRKGRGRSALSHPSPSARRLLFESPNNHRGHPTLPLRARVGTTAQRERGPRVFYIAR